MSIAGKWRRTRLGRVPKELSGMMQGEGPQIKHLKGIFDTVVEFFRVALEDSNPAVLVPRLNALDPLSRGFGYEGAGMGLALLDIIFPWKKRALTFLAGPASPYAYPFYVGMGLVMARVGKKPEKLLPTVDPVLGGFVIDGYGFRAATFSSQRHIKERALPKDISSAYLPPFDQGVGRSLWFSTGADLEKLQATIGLFPAERQANIWCGVGFACGYAGGVERPVIEKLRETVGTPYQLSLARGAALAAAGRLRSGDLLPHTEMACEVLCGLSASIAALVTDTARQDLPTTSEQPLYGVWQQRIEAELSAIVSNEAKQLSPVAP